MSVAKSFTRVLCVASFAALAAPALAQMPSYGQSVTVDTAKKIAAGAVVGAKKNGWPMAIAIVDTAGYLVYFERMDDTQIASTWIAVDKAKTSAQFRRPSRAFEEGIAKGRNAILGLQGATPITGGLPIVVGGKIIGGIGVSGAAADQDEQVAAAGLTALK
jgi:glc operon protein GlcG